MKKSLLFALVPLMSLFSCSGEAEKLTIDRNGDLLYGEGVTYETTAVRSSFEEIKEKKDNGEELFVAFFGSNCAHCIRFESVFSRYLSSSKARCLYLLNDGTETGYAEFLEDGRALLDYVGLEEESLVTPFLMHIGKEETTKFDIFVGNDPASLWGSAKTANYFNDRFSYTNVNWFENEANFLGDESAISFYVNEGDAEGISYFYSDLYPLLKEKETPSRVYFGSSSAIEEAFGLSEGGSAFRSGGIVGSLEEAKAVVENLD